MIDVKRFTSESISTSVASLARLGEVADEIANAGTALAAAYQAGNKALFFGNGGSAADAQHLAAELVVRFGRERRALPALALTVNSSVLTASANDVGYGSVFERQIEAFGVAGDVAVAITTSGQSPNIQSALICARKQKLKTIVLTSSRGAHLRSLADHLIAVPVSATANIQECHIVIGHLWCDLVERSL